MVLANRSANRAIVKDAGVEDAPDTPSLAELVSTLSIASDLGMGRPVERVLRQTVIAMRLADAAGVDPAVRAATYYTSLLTWVGCATDTSELVVLFGEEEDLFADTHDGDLAPMAMGMFVARHLGRGGSSLRRVGMVGRFLATAGRSVQRVMEEHCQAASDFAGGLGLGEEVRTPLVQAFERWDGKGVPGRAGADQVAPAIRLVHLADNVEAFHTRAAPRPRSPSPPSGEVPSSTLTSSTASATTPPRSWAGSGSCRRGTRSSPSIRRSVRRWARPCSTRR